MNSQFILTDHEISESFLNVGSSVKRQINLDDIKRESTIRVKSHGATGWDSWWLSFLQGSQSSFISGKTNNLNSIDLFSSIGGLSLGVSEAASALGFKISPQLASDLDKDALATYDANFSPKKVVHKSVSSLVNYQILGRGMNAELAFHPTVLDEAAEVDTHIDVIMGGPPCQGHSSLNNHTRGKDIRNDLYLTLPTMAIALGAKVVIIENVPRVVLDHGEVVKTTIKLLEDAGYFVTSGVLSANNFGWPQTRSRHFLIASRMKPPIDLDVAAQYFHRETRPLMWLFEDLLDALDPSSILNSVPILSPENKKRVDWLFENNAYELANHVRPVCHQDGHTYPSVYGRLYPDKPSPTITTGFQSPGRGRYVHPIFRRVLTAHEAARIQGFPDDFIYCAADGKPLQRTNLQKWIGDAVPSILGYIAGLVALQTLI